MDFTGERYVPNKVFGEIEVEHKQRYHAILDLVKNKKVLDAACGEGYGTNLISQRAEFVWGIDISEDSIQWANEAYHSTNIEFKVSDIKSLPISDHSVDVVVSFETIEHVDEQAQKKFLSEIKRVLKHDGILIMSTPDKRLYSDVVGFTNKFHIKEFYDHEFQNFLESDFKYTHMFRQGFKTFSHLASCHTEKNQATYYRLDDLYDTLNTGKYLIAVCSDKQLINLEKINSIMPLAKRKLMSKLLIDTGEGFNSESALSAELYIEGREFSVTFEALDKLGTIKSLKWIPLEGEMININILKYPPNIQMISLNSFGHRESFTEFQVMDPEFLINITGDTLKKLSLKGHIEILNSESIFQKLNTRIEGLQSEIENLQSILQDHEQLKEHLEFTKKERDNALAVNQNIRIENSILRNSTSWRITKPLRMISTALKRKKNKM
ncbi:methyltransferase domain-containing protein [Paenibacillus kyungheensis]